MLEYPPSPVEFRDILCPAENPEKSAEIKYSGSRHSINDSLIASTAIILFLLVDKWNETSDID